MISNFKHKGLKTYFENDDPKKLNSDHLDKIADILSALDAAQNIDEMNLITFRLHELQGKKKGIWSVTVRANWRITFKFKNSEATNVDYEDYH